MVGGSHQGTGVGEKPRVPLELVKGVHLPREVIQADGRPTSGGIAGRGADLEEGEVVVVGRVRSLEEHHATTLHLDPEAEHVAIESNAALDIAHVHHRVIEPMDSHGGYGNPVTALVRRARTADVPAIRALVDTYAQDSRLLDKATVTLYEDVQEFWVAEEQDHVVACGALHVLWRDLAEVRTLAVDSRRAKSGLGSAVLARLLDTAREIGVERVFCLTFETAFFARHGFRPIDGIPVEPGVYDELVQSYDEGVAEFLDLERVKPNTLGNTRMLLTL